MYGTKSAQSRVVPGWNEQVKEHYLQSRQAFHAWRLRGSPRNGDTADHMRQTRARFKLALRRCKKAEHEARALAIARKFNERNMQAFWRHVKSLNKNKPKLPSTIDNEHGKEDICKLWKQKFDRVLNSIHDEDDAQKLRYQLQNMEDVPVQLTTPGEIELIAKSLSSGKSSGVDEIPCEFYKHATPQVMCWISSMINAILIHGHIPSSITKVILTPILKSSLKDPCCSANYRPIAIASSISKIVENVILNRLDRFLSSTDYQFGFKKGHGTDMCIFALKEVVNYYKKLNTPVFLCFLDIKSAFDLVSYNKLFSLLCERRAPKYLIILLHNWYVNQKLYIRWAGVVSDEFGMQNGIRQGSCLSPKLFSVYVDKLNILLKDSGVGCHVSGVCTNNFSFADDMALVCPDAKSLNRLLEVCDDFAKVSYITYNTDKTEAMIIKPRGLSFDPPDVTLSGVKIKYVSQFKYLGHIITERFTDDEDIEREIRNLYIRGNTIARKFKFLENEMKCALFRSYCYPLYTSSLWACYRQSTLDKMKVCYNDVLRALFSEPRSSSARTLAVQNNIRSFFETFRVVAYSLMSRVEHSNNSLIYALLRSDSYTLSSTRGSWVQTLYTNGSNRPHFIL